MAPERASPHAFWGVSALLVAASVAATIGWSASMSVMGAMPMPGGWTMSMTWMRMPGQGWPGAAASFLGMWVVMMVAMMRAAPTAAGAIVVIGGFLQFTTWKAHHLACCRDLSAIARAGVDPRIAARQGLRLGLHCIFCCAGLMAILLAIGVMDLGAMAVVAAAIVIERFAPAGERVARAIGAVAIGVGMFLIARALIHVAASVC